MRPVRLAGVAPRATRAVGGPPDRRTLLAGNIAERENFAEAVTLTRRSLDSGFELTL